MQSLLKPNSFRLLLAFCLITVFNQSITAQPTVKIQDSPKWKTPIDWTSENNAINRSEDASYILLDFQDNEVLEEYCYRYVIRLNNDDRVQNFSQIDINFDPSYQQLFINQINVHRNGHKINKLNQKEIELYRNEKNADRFIYDQSYTALIILKDVRIGDILEYEYTIKGKTPLYGNNVYSSRNQQYNEEIEQIFQQIIIPVNQEIHYNSIANGILPNEEITNGTKKLTWNFNNVSALFSDEDVPSWYNAYPRCEISSFGTWSNVKDWERDLFPTQISTPEIDKFLKDEKISNSEEGIIKLIRFVQDEIRYLGLENGINSHKPHHPDEVLNNRFGDCKDKSFLLSTALRKLNVEAWPALVSTNLRDHFENRLPSPYLFNHVIVKFIWNDKTYWVDPTLTQARGDINHLQNPFYGKALVLDKSEGLEDIPSPIDNRVEINEKYIFVDSSTVHYKVETQYFENIATLRRSSHIGYPVAETRNNYLNYYSTYHNTIAWANDSALHYEDFPEINSFKTNEEYIIKDSWEPGENDTTELFTDIRAFNLYEFLSTSNDQSRTMPLFVYYPIKVNHTIQLIFPKHKNVGFSSTSDSIINSAFTFRKTTTNNRKDHTYTINLYYETKQDYVAADDTEDYFNDYDELKENCYENIRWGASTLKDTRKNYTLIVLAILFCIALLFASIKLYKQNFGNEPKPNALPWGGWLILPVIGLYVSLISILVQVFNVEYFSQTTYENVISISSQSALFTSLTFYFELFFNLYVIGFCIVLIVLQIKKRTSFPLLFIIFRSSYVAGLIIDLYLSYQILGSIESGKEVIQNVVYAAIWIPYFIYSERVKNTFVNTYSAKNKSELNNPVYSEIE